MPFGDQQPFDLIELKEMARIDRVAPIAAARRDDRDRRLVLLHRANLHRRGVRPQQQRVGDKERVEAFARRMSRRNVERVEVVVIGLDFGAEHDGEAAPLKVRASHRAARGVSGGSSR